MTVNFPDQATHDEKSVTRMGYVQNVYYTRKEVSEKGNNPELRISNLPDEVTTATSEKTFDGTSSIKIHPSDSHGLDRTSKDTEHQPTAAIKKNGSTSGSTTTATQTRSTS